MIRDPESFADILAGVTRFVRERLIPAEAVVEETDAIPADIVAEMRAMGLFGLSIPTEFGGLGFTAEEIAAVIEQLCYASPAYRSFLAGNTGVASQTILLSGTPEQCAQHLPPIASGEHVASFCLTEPDAGSDAASLKTRAVRDGDGYVISGSKRFITNAPIADVFVVLARTDASVPAAHGISAFVVAAGTEGLSVGPPMKKMGQRGAQIADVHFDDVRVAADAMLGSDEGTGFQTVMRVLDRGRLHIAAVALGLGRRALDEALNYARQREQFGQPLASFQMVKAMIADSEAELYAAKCMVADAVRRLDAGERVTLEASCAKLFATEMAGRVVDRAVQIHGGSGYVADFPAERLYRDARVLRIYEGASEVQRLVISREALARGDAAAAGS